MMDQLAEVDDCEHRRDSVETPHVPIAEEYVHVSSDIRVA
jgi:hypothetical protein